MKKLTATSLFLIVFAALATSPTGRVDANEEPVAKSESVEPYFFVVAADPQLLWKQKDDSNWRRTIKEVNRLGPDFMIVCGDLIQAPNNSKAWDNPASVASFNKLADIYLAAAKDLKPTIPLYNVAGNHDVSQQPTEKSLAWYEERFGKAWYSFEHKNSLFVVLESNLLRDDAGAPDIARRQWQWLESTLEKTEKKDYDHKTAYMHHPMCIHSVDEKDGYFNMPQQPRAKLLDLFQKHGFKAVFCGHYHKNAYVKAGDLELITTSSCGVPLGKDKTGFRIVKVYPDRIEHDYFEFDKLPERVDLGAGAAKQAE